MDDNRQFTATFYNAAPFPVDIIWINYEGIEEVAKSNLIQGDEFEKTTSFNHTFLVKRHGTDVRQSLQANRVTDDIFEGLKFGVTVNTNIRVTICKMDILIKFKS